LRSARGTPDAKNRFAVGRHDSAAILAVNEIAVRLNGDPLEDLLAKQLELAVHIADAQSK